jgi:hypothetical protein
MAQAERNLTVIGWVLPGTAKRRTLSRELIASRSSSILQHRNTKSQMKATEPISHAKKKSVTIIEGRKNLILYLEEDQEDAKYPQGDNKVMMQVDYAASGDEG